MRGVGIGMAFLSIGLGAAIFGFFYAWICSTMWGLDGADPRVAVAAMQAMNASVRNAVFAPAFFGTPFVMLATAAILRGRAGLFFGLAGAVSLMGSVALTMGVHVPLNEALAVVEVPDDIAPAAEIWQAYSPRWQVFNITRTVFCGVALMLAATGLWALARRPG